MNSFLNYCDGLPIVTFGAGECVIKEGNKELRLLFLKSGEIEILKGTVHINTVVLPGTILGEVSALLGRPHLATVRAKTDCSFYVADNPDEFLGNHPELAIKIGRTLAGRLYSATNKLAAQLSDKAGDGEESQLSDFIKGLYQGDS